MEIVENTARDLAAKVPKDCEYVMTAETKGIPLAAELARNLGQMCIRDSFMYIEHFLALGKVMRSNICQG